MPLKYSKDISVSELKEKIKIETKMPTFYIKLFYKKDSKIVFIKDNQKLSEISTNLNSKKIELYIKQQSFLISSDNMKFIGYIGPIFIWPILLIVSGHITNFTILFTILASLHYLKRVLEVKYVHISNKGYVDILTVTIYTIFYWGNATVIPCYELFYYSKVQNTYSEQGTILNYLVFDYLLFEFLNGLCHWKLRQLRLEKFEGKYRKTFKKTLPRGLFFDHVICPNYSFEVLSWLVFAALTRSYGILFFIIYGGTVMYGWGKDKRKSYAQLPDLSDEEREAVKSRKILFPYLI